MYKLSNKKTLKEELLERLEMAQSELARCELRLQQSIDAKCDPSIRLYTRLCEKYEKIVRRNKELLENQK